MGPASPRVPPTTALDGRDEPADVYVVITVHLEKTAFTRFPSGTNSLVPERFWFSAWTRQSVGDEVQEPEPGRFSVGLKTLYTDPFRKIRISISKEYILIWCDPNFILFFLQNLRSKWWFLHSILIFWIPVFVGFMSWKPKLCTRKQINTWNRLNCGPWIYNLWKFNFFNGIVEIKQLFHDILIFRKGSVLCHNWSSK